MYRFYILLLLNCVVFSAAAKLEKTNVQLVTELEETFRNLDNAVRKESMKADSLKRIIDRKSHSSDSYIDNERLGNYYLEHDVDSAMFYWQIARQEAIVYGNTSDAKRIEFKMLSTYPFLGMGAEALKDLESVNYNELNDSLRHQYWVANTSIYCALQHNYSKGKYKELYRHKTIESLDSILNFYPSGSPEYGFIVSVQHYLSGDEHLAVANISQLLQYFVEVPPMYEMALLRMVHYYRDKPADRQEYVRCVFQLAKSSMQRGITNPVIMSEAGKILYDEGFKTLGRSMILRAMKSKVSGARPLIPFDYTDYVEYLSDKALKVRVWLAIIFIVMLIIIVSLSVMHARWKKTSGSMYADVMERLEYLESMNESLRKSLDSAVALSFINIEQLHEFNLFVQRKLKAGQARELYREVNSGEYMDELQRSFFDTFDELFLESFPEFFNKLNELLLPDKQLTVHPGNHLTPELRIAAFMRFGMNDSAKLAKALGLSLNTIYAYRNRLKSRAINRSTFEEDVRNMICR